MIDAKRDDGIAYDITITVHTGIENWHRIANVQAGRQVCLRTQRRGGISSTKLQTCFCIEKEMNFVLTRIFECVTVL